MSPRFKKACANLLLMLAPLLIAGAPDKKNHEDWSHFRGPSLNGRAKGKLESSLEPKWKKQVGSPSLSSPMVRANRVYIGSTDNAVLALSTTDGSQIWRTPVDASVEAPPLLMENSLIVGSMDGAVHSIEIQSGKLEWSYKTEGKILGSAAAISSKKGETIVIIGSYDGNLHAIEAKTGKSLWKFNTENHLHGSPSHWGNNLVIGGCDSRLHIVSPTDGKRIKAIELGAQIGATPLIERNRAYVGTYGNRFLSVDLLTNAIAWEYRDQNFPFFSSAAKDKDVLYVGSRDRKVHSLDLKTGTPIWTFRTMGKIDGSPIICDGKLVFGSSDGRLYILDAGSGEKLWSYDLGSAVEATPAVWNGMVWVGTNDGVLHAFGPSTPAQPPTPTKAQP